MPSIQPKQSASSTASSYSTQDRPVCLREKTSQTSSADAWLRSSHLRHCLRSRALVLGFSSTVLAMLKLFRNPRLLSRAACTPPVVPSAALAGAEIERAPNPRGDRLQQETVRLHADQDLAD